MHSSIPLHRVKNSPAHRPKIQQRICRPRSSSLAMESSVKTSACELTVQQVDELASESIVWAAQNGLVMGLPVQDASRIVGSGVQAKMVHAPVSLVPTPFKKELFERALALAKPFNVLMDRVSADKEYLRTTLKEASKGDPFTGRLLALMNDVDTQRGARTDPVKLIINRSDYMVDEPSGGILQVEINMISASFACLSTQVAKLHRQTVGKVLEGVLESERVPANAATDGLAEGIAAAHSAMALPGSKVLMVVQPNERNAYDQQWLASTLWDRYRVRVFRRTLEEVAAQGRVDPTTGQLTVDGINVSVAYLRSGYAPTDYPDTTAWEGRRVLELSTACKCPDLSQQLSGAKRIQQDLCRPGVLERFVPEPETVTALRRCFAGQWSLEGLGSSPELESMVRAAMSDPGAFVLKPQREGGGNNFYDAELQEKMRVAVEVVEGRRAAEDPALEELRSYILMEKIRTPKRLTLFMRDGQYFAGESISELGVYGVFVRKEGEPGPRVDLAAGHLLRTKMASSNEGGVAAGYAVLDSPYLI